MKGAIVLQAFEEDIALLQFVNKVPNCASVYYPVNNYPGVSIRDI